MRSEQISLLGLTFEWHYLLRLFNVFANLAILPIFPFCFEAIDIFEGGMSFPCGIPNALCRPPLFFMAPFIHFFIIESFVDPLVAEVARLVPARVVRV